MDSDNKPNDSANGPVKPGASTSAGSEVDEAQAVAILNEAAASKSTAVSASDSTANAGGAGTNATESAEGTSPAAEDKPADTASDAAGAGSDVPNTGAAVDSAASPTAPVAAETSSAASSLAPDSPTPHMADSSSVLGAASAAPGAPGMVAPSKGKKMLILAVAAVLFVLVVVGGVAAAFYQVMNRPQNVLNTALENAFSSTKVTSASFEGSVDVKPKDGTTLTTTFTGSADAKTGAMTLSAKLDAVVATVGLDLRTTDGTTLYLRVSGLDGLAALLSQGSSSDSGSTIDAFAPLISTLNNQWVEINPSMIKQLTGTDTNLNAKLTDADRQKLADAYKSHQFLIVSKSFKDEAIKGKQSKHYQITIDKTQLKAFVTTVANDHIAGLKPTTDGINSFNKMVDKLDTAKYPVDVWISKSDKLIDQVSLTATSNGTTITLRSTMDDYNAPVHVTAPDGAKSILDILSGLLASPTASSDLNSLSNSGGISL